MTSQPSEQLFEGSYLVWSITHANDQGFAGGDVAKDQLDRFFRDAAMLEDAGAQPGDLPLLGEDRRFAGAAHLRRQHADRVAANIHGRVPGHKSILTVPRRQPTGHAAKGFTSDRRAENPR